MVFYFSDALTIFVEDDRKALVERKVLVTQLTTAREVVRVVLAEVCKLRLSQPQLQLK